MYLSIIFLPLLGSIVSGLLGRKVGVTGSQIITCTSLIVSSFLITVAFYEVGICASPVAIDIISWLDIEILSISWSFYFDQLTVSLCLAVLYCSTLIHIYSVDYLSTDPAKHFGKMFKWVKLSNSGNTLKLLIPSYIRKNISGWSHYSGMVTSQNMIENEMGNRGSKSENIQTQSPNRVSVKEQRVDGSCFLAQQARKLRCTLMGGASYYQTKNPF